MAGAAKYDIAKVTPETYQPLLVQMYAFCGVIMRLPVNQMISMAERAQSNAAIIDPALFKLKGPALEQDLVMMRALQHVQVEMAALQASIESKVVAARADAPPPAANAQADNAE